MQVSYKRAGASDYSLLFDEGAGDALETDQGVFAGILQREPLAGSSPAAARFARGNVVGKSQFKWTSTYASAALARAAIAAISALKLTPLHLQIIEGATTQYLPNAQSEMYGYDRQGSSVTHTLSFESDDLTTNEPA